MHVWAYHESFYILLVVDISERVLVVLHRAIRLRTGRGVTL
jgi:hypothetical protein